MQVWTYKGRVAFVLSVLEKNKPVADHVKLQRLSQIMLDIMVEILALSVWIRCASILGGQGPCRSISQHCLVVASARAVQWYVPGGLNRPLLLARLLQSWSQIGSSNVGWASLASVTPTLGSHQR